MNVKEIHIRRQASYEKNPGMLTGTISFMHGIGEVTVNISEAQANQMIALLADALVETAKLVGKTMTTEILEQTKALPKS